MNLGQICIYLSFALSLASAWYYMNEARRGTAGGQGKSVHHPLSGMWMFRLSAATLLLASVFLMILLFTHQFQYGYVAHFSARSSPAIYLVSAFWAGQEGTFLFWAMVVSAMGVVFMRRTSTHDGYAMGTVSLFVAFLDLLMIVKSPFEMLAEVPADGTGLNPLLQDPWMAIHPPILFVGYAAAVFPFALVISGLVRRDFVRWRESGFAWTLFSTVALGAGIIIGGFWAYEVLGWGGYWGWDPVENSSLVPWLMLLALVHGLIVERGKGSLRRTNILLALLSFILVLYATFLTRSGVLADFSVHSFTDEGINYYLIGSLVLGVGVSAALFIIRFRTIRSPKIDFSSLNREVTLLFSLIVLAAAAIFTFVGMSSPIITGLFGKASQVETDFYNTVNLPVAIAMAILLGVTPFLGWTEERKSGLFRRLSMSLVLTALSIAIAYVAGVTAPVMMLFVGASAFGLISNVIITFRQYRTGWLSIGGPISHIGVALLLIGIIGSGSYDDSTKIQMKNGESRSAYGYEFTFKGVSESADGKTGVDLEVSDGRMTFQAHPKLYFSQFSQAMMREPDIKVLPLKDLYLSPLELKTSGGQNHEHPSLQLAKGETKEIGGYRIGFDRFETGEHGNPGSMAVGAVLRVTAGGKEHEIIPKMVMNEQGQRETTPVDLPSLVNPSKGAVHPQVVFAGMNVEQQMVLLEFLGFDEHHEDGQSYELLLDVSTKPLMMVLWTGVVLIIGGTVIAFRRRIGE
jgi:cytochrome c-type biogenesis protein CcmF